MITETLAIVLTGDVAKLFALKPDMEDKDSLPWFRTILRTPCAAYGSTDTTVEPQEVEFFYLPAMQRQRMYENLPFNTGLSYSIVDAFACSGARFGLKDIQVFVEICESACGKNPLWANIYYVADSQKPAAIATLQKWSQATSWS